MLFEQETELRELIDEIDKKFRRMVEVGSMSHLQTPKLERSPQFWEN